MSKHIHHLIAFCDDFFRAREVAEQLETSGDKEALKEFRESKLYHHSLMGGRYRGSFLDKQVLIDKVKASKDVYGICEGYYTYLLIETHRINCIDGYCFDPPEHKESEMWFKFTKLDEDNYEYQQIERPEVLKGVCGFL